MKPGSRTPTTLASLILPAMLALWFARPLIQTFTAQVTVGDMRAFYAIGLVSRLATGES
jgi:hypothetical protein